MKEFTTSIKSSFSRGLRPDDRIPRNSGYLHQCQNARIVDIGDVLTPSIFTPITYPSGIQDVTGTFPFPQLFKGREVTLLVGSTSLYTISESGNWTETPVTTRDWYYTGEEKAIIAGSSWHFADFGTSYALFNGSCTVFKTSRLSILGGTNHTLVMDVVSINTGCDCRGRMIMGGFNPANFWSGEHWTAMRSLMWTGAAALGLAVPAAPGTNCVFWSPIGSGAFFLFYADDYTKGLIADGYPTPNVTMDNFMLVEMIKRNEFGFMPMNWQGTVRCVKTLGKGVMVYGDNGISYMPMVGETFGLVDILHNGIESRSAVGGNEKEHVFIDEAGWLWRIPAEEIGAVSAKRHRLGFREYFEDMIGDDIVVSYDPIECEYHISNGVTCFVLTKDGALFESTFLVTSIAVSNGGAVGVYKRPGTATQGYTILASDVIDMGLRSIKTIERVVLSTTNTTAVSVAVDWRYKTSDSWSRTPYYNINYEGVAYLPVMGLEFRVIVQCTDYTKMDLDDVEVQFKTNDKRIIRGTYALENVARSGG